MSLDTYAGLKAEVADWLNKTNLTAQIPTFIALAEAQMRRELTFVGQVETWAEAEIDEDGWILPCRAEEVASVTYDGRALAYVPPENISVADAERPTWYTIDGNVLKIQPAGTVDIRVKTSFCPLSPSVSRNWILRDHPDAYLYGALMQAAPYLRDDERIGVWGDLFQAAISSINAREVRRQVGSNLRMDAGVTP